MEIIEMTLVEVQELCAKDEQFRHEFEKWWNAFKRRHNIATLHH